MKLSVMQENLARGLSVVSRAVSSRSTLPVLANVLLRTEDAGLKLTADEPRDRHHLLGPGQDRDRRRDHGPGPPADRPRELAARRRAGRPRAPGRRHAPRPVPAASRPTSRASTPTSSRRSRRPASARRRGSARRSSSGRSTRRFRGRQRRGPADPHRRPRPVRGRQAHARGRRQLPDRGPHDRHPRSRRGGVGGHPGACAQRAEPDPRRHGRPRRAGPRPGANQVLFHLEGIDLVSRLIDGQFPNYQQVLPRRHTTRAELDREELLRAVRPAALIASSRRTS